ncbi:MAG TPA: hypothetical protein VLV78_16840 [Thermoanaerobaculia bacterium]|nr:hypothetical protein [Thermoanaerobaculia bacterium]
MRVRDGVVAASIVAALLASGCTGGKESTAAEEAIPQKNGITQPQQTATTVPSAAEPVRELKSIGPAIPVYAGARYRDDLTRRDEVMIRNQYGPQAKVYTLATDDSFPQVYHYYTTYLAQFRAYPAQSPYPPEQQSWRTLEVQLNQAMQDPFIPGESLRADGRQVVLQVAETEAEPKTVIRYIITPPPQATVATASTGAVPAPVAR